MVMLRDTKGRIFTCFLSRLLALQFFVIFLVRVKFPSERILSDQSLVAVSPGKVVFCFVLFFSFCFPRKKNVSKKPTKSMSFDESLLRT